MGSSAFEQTCVRFYFLLASGSVVVCNVFMIANTDDKSMIAAFLCVVYSSTPRRLILERAAGASVARKRKREESI